MPLSGPGPRRVLVLGGTSDARRLATLLEGRAHVTSSLAGRVRAPVLPPGEVRIGGFGGIDGLVAYLRSSGTDVVVDATHPFAARMSAHAAAASRATGIPLVQLRRPGWEPDPSWTVLPSLVAAAAVLPGIGRRIFLTTGRQELAVFAGLDDLWFLARSVDPPAGPVPRHLHTILDRGPFTVAGETALMREHGIDVLVTKDSGGDMTAAKLDAARELDIPVVIVARPPLPPGFSQVTTAEDGVALLFAQPE
ncbi:MAG: cobalt-precorrin-6A reductase [Pseudonocardia sp.]|nr:cobalt-precorrin-6A reductase [Pseudonocardia sp.]